MKKLTIILVLLLICFLTFSFIFKEKHQTATISALPITFALSPTISVYPETILPGDPLIITIDSILALSDIFFDNKKIPTFVYEGKTRAFVGIPFEEKVLKHNIKAIFENGKIATTSITLMSREKIERPLGIPEKLGGNTPEASKAIVNNLAIENATLVNIKTATTTLWKSAFGNPLENIFITDDYGYNRDTVGQTIVHKGTDFRASLWTEIRAMNSGIVRIAKTYIIYGNTIVIDHGLGVQTLYMHLSKINVKEGDMVEKGQIIGKSGSTGYAESAHLHISIKIGGVSIDPMKFMELFNML